MIAVIDAPATSPNRRFPVIRARIDFSDTPGHDIHAKEEKRQPADQTGGQFKLVQIADISSNRDHLPSVSALSHRAAKVIPTRFRG